MDWLDVIIFSSLHLAAGALSLMTLLIAGRSIRNLRRRRDAALADKLVRLALEYVELPEHHAALKHQLAHAERRVLLQALADLVPKVKGEFAEQIVALMNTLGLLETALKQLRSWRWWKRMEAATQLQRFPDPRAIAALRDALDDRRLEVRVEAARSLAHLGAAPHPETLLLKLTPRHGAPSLRVAELFRSYDETFAPEMLTALKRDLPESSKLILIDAVAHIAGPIAVQQLADMYLGSTPNIRGALIRAARLAGGPESWKLLQRGLEDSNSGLRAQAATACGYVQDARAVPRLEALLQDSEWWVRYSAAEALLRLRGAGLIALWNAAAGAGGSAEIAAGVLKEKGLLK